MSSVSPVRRTVLCSREYRSALATVGTPTAQDLGGVIETSVSSAPLLLLSMCPIRRSSAALPLQPSVGTFRARRDPGRSGARGDP
ncbi:hypothetical protein HEP87_59525 [Streptomyces sp. S1D4-11]|nr:hypothetical protein [Streptomyces sp. S1D4-11]